MLVERLGVDTVARLCRSLPGSLDELRLDPAVGSGAFPLGMLSEIIRLRTLCYESLHREEPGPELVHAWKLHAMQHALFGVDIEPRAIELCRLRLWLSLIVDLPPGAEAHPLPNLEFRTVVADSLVDFVHGIEVQNTRSGLSFFSEPDLPSLHDQWFSATGPLRDGLRERIEAIENQVITRQLGGAWRQAKTEADRDQIDELAIQFRSVDRAFPCFVPGLHFPDVQAHGGWDIVIMNPPYVGRKEIPATA